MTFFQKYSRWITFHISYQRSIVLAIDSRKYRCRLRCKNWNITAINFHLIALCKNAKNSLRKVFRYYRHSIPRVINRIQILFILRRFLRNDSFVEQLKWISISLQQLISFTDLSSSRSEKDEKSNCKKDPREWLRDATLASQVKLRVSEEKGKHALMDEMHFPLLDGKIYTTPSINHPPDERLNYPSV